MRAHIPERAANPVDITILEALPLTSIGKIYKPPLKNDAAQRAFVAALGNLAAEVTVDDDSVSGNRARIVLAEGASEAEVRAIMGHYIMIFDIG